MKMVVHHLERDYPNLREKRRCLRHHIHHKHKILLPRKKQRRLLPRSICVPIRSAIPKCRLATPLPFLEYPHNLNRISFRPPKARFPGGNAARIQFVRSNANPPDKFRFSVTLSGQTVLSPQNNKKASQVRYNLTRFAGSWRRGYQSCKVLPRIVAYVLKYSSSLKIRNIEHLDFKRTSPSVTY